MDNIIWKVPSEGLKKVIGSLEQEEKTNILKVIEIIDATAQLLVQKRQDVSVLCDISDLAHYSFRITVGPKVPATMLNLNIEEFYSMIQEDKVTTFQINKRAEKQSYSVKILDNRRYYPRRSAFIKFSSTRSNFWKIRLVDSLLPMIRNIAYPQEFHDAFNSFTDMLIELGLSRNQIISKISDIDTHGDNLVWLKRSKDIALAIGMTRKSISVTYSSQIIKDPILLKIIESIIGNNLFVKAILETEKIIDIQLTDGNISLCFSKTQTYNGNRNLAESSRSYCNIASPSREEMKKIIDIMTIMEL